MKKIVTMMITIAALSITVAAVAGEQDGAFSVSPFIGGYTFGGVQHLETKPVYGLRIGYDLTKNWGVEAVGDYVNTEGTHNNTSINALSYRLDFLYNIMPNGPLVPYLAVGGGGITGGHGPDGLKIRGNTTDGTLNAGIGLKLFLNDTVALRGDARQIFAFEGPQSSTKYNWEYSIGLTFLLASKKAVEPPPTPAPTCNLTVKPDSIMQGQSTILSWSSQNAVNCEIQPNIGSVNLQGDMTISPNSDVDYTLSCSGSGGTSSSSKHIRVAELPTPATTANILISPSTLSQGQTANLSWTSQNATSCDIQPNIGSVQPQGSMIITPSVDTNYIITCSGPNNTVTSTTSVAVVVPPPPVVVPPPPVLAPVKTKDVERFCEKPSVIVVEFDTNKSVIKTKYDEDLNKLGTFLNEWPRAKGEISGYTDNVGTAKYNKGLSQRRAASVKAYLVDKFKIDPKRLTTEGYGESKPIASNKTKEGRKLNRRIETHFTCENM